MSDEDTAPQSPDPQAEGPAPEALPNLTDDTTAPAADVPPSEVDEKQAAAVDDVLGEGKTVDPDHPYAPIANDERDPDAVLDNPEAWTVQSPHAHVRVDGRPGYVVTKAELPNFDKLKEAGIDVEQYVAGLVVAADDEARDLIQSAEAAWQARVRAKEAAKDAGVQPVDENAPEE